MMTIDVYCRVLIYYSISCLLGIVFSAALCEHYPVGSSEFLSKLVYTTIFGIIAIPLCLLGVKEQAAFQVFMTGVRLLVIAIMSGTAFGAYYSGVDSFSGMTLNPTPAPRFRAVSLAVMLPVSFFSLMLNSYTPTVVQVSEGFQLDYNCCLAVVEVMDAMNGPPRPT